MVGRGMPRASRMALSAGIRGRPQGMSAIGTIDGLPELVI